MSIEIREIDARTFEVIVKAEATTSHRVTAEAEYVAGLTSGQVPASELVKKSFEFLLEREPNTSILREFDLAVIGRYFPEYEGTIQATLRG